MTNTRIWRTLEQYGTVLTASDGLESARERLGSALHLRCGPFWSNVQATWSPVMESWPIYCEQKMLEDDRAGKIWKDLVSDAFSTSRPASSRYQTVAVCKAGIQPDEVTYATVISALTKDRGSEKQCPEAA